MPTSLKRDRLRQLTQILCQYYNNTQDIQIVCISNIDDCHFERTVFPGQRLIFETVPEAVLEVRTGTTPTTLIADRIPCLRLRAASHVTPLHQQILHQQINREPTQAA